LAGGAGYISPPLAPTDLIPEKMKFNSRKSEIKWNLIPTTISLKWLNELPPKYQKIKFNERAFE